ncbi:hypothetical protein K438DRAFT_1937312 [Mycena galopus ATCC 62051]|nr:hypothetical protein K438DRAFT_1937312 [Mycena galopus ATCC 62051]
MDHTKLLEAHPSEGCAIRKTTIMNAMFYGKAEFTPEELVDDRANSPLASSLQGSSASTAGGRRVDGRTELVAHSVRLMENSRHLRCMQFNTATSMALIAEGVPRARPTHTQHCSSLVPTVTMYPSDWDAARCLLMPASHHTEVENDLMFGNDAPLSFLRCSNGV